MRRALHRTARGSLLSLAGALAALGCTSAAPRATTVLTKVPERIVILPLNVATPMPAELKSTSPQVWSALELYLRAHGAALKTVAYPTARGLWLASIREAKADPKRKDPGFDDAASLLVGKLKEYADFDAMVIPSLYIQRAVLSGTQATWDGSERTLAIETRRGEVPVPADAAIEGVVPAVSLHAVVFNAEGHRLHEGRAGLALLVRARMSPRKATDESPVFSFIALRDPFEDRAFLVQGTARALAPFVPLLPAGRLGEIAARIPSTPAAESAPAEEPPP